MTPNSQTPRFLAATLLSTTVMLVLVGIFMIWTYQPWAGPPRNPDGSIDNALVRSIGIFVSLAPLAFAAIASGLYVITRLLYLARLLYLWVLIFAAVSASALIGWTHGRDYYRDMIERPEIAQTALSGAVFEGGMTAAFLAAILISGCIIWWRAAWRKPNHLMQPTANGG